MSIKLYGSYTSPYVRHCRTALNESGLDWELIETDATASATQSPTQKVPFLKHGDVCLTDSSSIVRYVREQAGQSFCPDITDYDLLCTANTLLDACVNLFLLERFGGKDLGGNPYLKRQGARNNTGLAYLESLTLSAQAPFNDGELRLACFLDWGLFRERLSLEGYPKLQAFLSAVRQHPAFASTQPPADA